jgi:membrane-associated phospholipid phosphatase
MMMRIVAFFAVFLCLLRAPVAQAQDSQGKSQSTSQREDQLDIPRSSDPGKQPFVRLFLRDQVDMWTSPFRASSYESRGFFKYVVPFTLITGALIATDRQTSNLLPNTEDQSKWSLRVSQIGAPYTLAGISAGMYFISRKTKDKKARETGFLGAEVIAHTQIFTLVLKSATQRTRPGDAKEENIGGTAFWRGGDSFPSGHASGSFGLATIFAYEYGKQHKWVPYVAYGLASVVAASRLSAQKHWVSDIFVGGSMGFLVGRYIYKVHHDPRIDGISPRRAERFIPNVGYGRRGVTLTWGL